MGNQQFKCPVEAIPAMAPLSCVMDCSNAKPAAFEMRTVDGAQRCVSKDDPDISVSLIPQQMVLRPVSDNSLFSIDSLKTSNQEAYTRYSAEFERFSKEMSTAQGKVSRKKQVDTAVKNLEEAAPGEATHIAKSKYMELTGDPETVTRQLDEAAKMDAEKSKNEFISEYQFLRNQSDQQQNTLDLIQSVKDNLFTVKDDMEFSVNTFSKQVDEIRNQITMNRQKRKHTVDYAAWMSAGLNIAIVLALLFVVFVVGRKAMARVSPSQPTVLPSRPPTASPETTAFFNSFTKHLSGNA